MAQARHDSVVSRYSLKDATERDIPAMHELRSSAILAVNRFYYSEELLAGWATELIPNVFAPERFRVAVANDGMICGLLNCKDRVLSELYTHPEHQSRGIATMLLNEFEFNIALSGIQNVTLTASLNSEAFYAKRGWRTLEFTYLRISGGLSFPGIKMAKAIIPQVQKNV